MANLTDFQSLGLPNMDRWIGFLFFYIKDLAARLWDYINYSQRSSALKGFFS